MEWGIDNEIICDSQNGFRKGRSTINHVQSIMSILETRKLKGQSTFAAFIDFTKAYDSINRDLLFTKLAQLGLKGRIFNAITSLHENVKCCVRINGLKTENIEVGCGLKQCCILSTLLFNLCVNDLVIKINNLNIGIDTNGEKVAILLYEDDLLLVAAKEEDLHVWSIISYGAAIWGNRLFSCVNTVLLRAAKYYMGVGRYTSNSAVLGDTGWKPTVVRQLLAVINQYVRLKEMDTT